MSNYPDDATYDRIHDTVTQVARCAIANAIHAEVSGEVHHLVYNAVANVVNSGQFDDILDKILDQIFDPAPLDDEQNQVDDKITLEYGEEWWEVENDSPTLAGQHYPGTQFPVW